MEFPVWYKSFLFLQDFGWRVPHRTLDNDLWQEDREWESLEENDEREPSHENEYV